MSENDKIKLHMGIEGLRIALEEYEKKYAESGGWDIIHIRMYSDGSGCIEDDMIGKEIFKFHSIKELVQHLSERS
jgi:hypothetical protein